MSRAGTKKLPAAQEGADVPGNDLAEEPPMSADNFYLPTL